MKASLHETRTHENGGGELGFLEVLVNVRDLKTPVQIHVSLSGGKCRFVMYFWDVFAVLL